MLISKEDTIRNFISYAGHKYHVSDLEGNLLQETLNLVNEYTEVLYEPFAGMGVVSFNVLKNYKELCPGLLGVKLSDLNEYNVNLFNDIKDNPEDLKDSFSEILSFKKLNRDYFHVLRSDFNKDKRNSALYAILMNSRYGNILEIDSKGDFGGGFDGNRTVRTTETQDKQILDYCNRIDEYHELMNCGIDFSYVKRDYYDIWDGVDNSFINSFIFDPPYHGSSVNYKQNTLVALDNIHGHIIDKMVNHCMDYNFISFNYLTTEGVNQSMLYLRKCKAVMFKAFLTNYNFRVQMDRDKQNGVELVIYNKIKE